MPPEANAGWEQWLGERPLAVIATVDAAGMPHAVPVEVVVDAGHVYSWCRRSSARVKNVRLNRRAAIVAYKGNAYVLVRGPARLLHAGDEGYDGLSAKFLAKYRREETYGNDTLVVVSAERVVVRGLD